MAYIALPYKIVVLAPFAPVPDAKFKLDFVKIDINTIDQAMEKISPVLYLPVSSDLCTDGALTLKFNKIKDFKPDSIIKNNSYLRSLKDKKKLVQDMDKDTRSAKSKSKNEAKSKIDDILSMVAAPDISLEKIAKSQNESNLSPLLKEIYSNREFQKTESAWRGIQTLVKKTEIRGFKEIDLRISSVSHNSLESVLEAIESLPHSQIPNLLIIDLPFDNTNRLNDLLEIVVNFTDKMLLPAVVWIKPDFFRIENWNKLDTIPYVKNYLEDSSYAKWRKIKQHPGAMWLMETCNSFPVRDPNEFEQQPLFASPVFALGTLCAKSVKESGWPTGFTRYNSIKIDNLPMFNVDEKVTVSAETLLSEDRIMQFMEAGITPLAGVKNKDFVFMPKQTSLAGESIKFQMFFNRIIEVLTDIRDNISLNQNTNDEIASVLSNIFINSGNNSPDDISVIRKADELDDQIKFMISFTPPASVLSGSGKIEFSFAW